APTPDYYALSLHDALPIWNRIRDPRQHRDFWRDGVRCAFLEPDFSGGLKSVPFLSRQTPLQRKCRPLDGDRFQHHANFQYWSVRDHDGWIVDLFLGSGDVCLLDRNRKNPTFHSLVAADRSAYRPG